MKFSFGGNAEKPVWMLEDEEKGWVEAECSLFISLLRKLDRWTDRYLPEASPAIKAG